MIFSPTSSASLGPFSPEEYRDGLKKARISHVEILDSGADLNAYAQIDGQVCCCGGKMVNEPVSIAVWCCSPAPAGSSDCCAPAKPVAIAAASDGGLVLFLAQVEAARTTHAARSIRSPLHPERLRRGFRRQTTKDKEAHE
jgi:hypothetical protein